MSARDLFIEADVLSRDLFDVQTSKDARDLLEKLEEILAKAKSAAESADDETHISDISSFVSEARAWAGDLEDLEEVEIPQKKKTAPKKTAPKKTAPKKLEVKFVRLDHNSLIVTVGCASGRVTTNREKGRVVSYHATFESAEMYALPSAANGARAALAEAKAWAVTQIQAAQSSC